MMVWYALMMMMMMSYSLDPVVDLDLVLAVVLDDDLRCSID